MRTVVRKTYKMLIGGQFVRSESGRSLEVGGVNVCHASRKDVRDAVKAARAACSGWSAKTAMNRGQILYRMAEMLEARSQDFSDVTALQDVENSIDLLVHYAGWADKYQQCLATVNPVAAPYFNFSFAEPMGVVGVACGGTTLTSMVGAVAPVLTGGNTCVMLASDQTPVMACVFAEVVSTSDVPAGVLNILTGIQGETLPHLAQHMDVNALAVHSEDARSNGLLAEAAENLKRVSFWPVGEARDSLAAISTFQETKTVWHPIGL